jgi:hypothetical protein
MVSFTHRSLYPREKEPQVRMDRRLGGPQNRSGQRGEKKILDPTGTRTPTHRINYGFKILFMLSEQSAFVYCEYTLILQLLHKRFLN